MKASSRRVLPLVALLFSSSALFAQTDVAFFGVFKNQIFEQDNPFVPVLRADESGSGERPLSFGVFIALTGTNKVTGASVLTPGGSTINAQTNSTGDALEFSAPFDSLLELDGNYGDGTYTVTINGVNDGQQVIALNLSGDAYPSTPRYANLTAAQAIDAAAEFTLSWDPMDGGTSNDIVMVEIRQETANGDTVLFSSPGPGEPGQLTGLDTSVAIPANNLAAGGTYLATIRFIRPVSTSATYASGLAGYMKETLAEIRTSSAGSSDTQAPNFNGSYPFSDATDVADTSVVTFEFSEAMDTGVAVSNAIAWTGVSDPANFVYSWSADARRLFCQYTPTLPLSATVGWTLNPSGSSAKLRDAAQNNLIDGIFGQFTTRSNSLAGQPDAVGLLVAKAETFLQTNSAPVALGHFLGLAEMDLRGIVTARRLSVSGPFGGPVAAELDHGDAFTLQAQFALKSDLDAFFPNGRYTNEIDAVHDGTKTLVLDTGQDAYPVTPTVQNLSVLGAVDSSLALNLQWDAFAGGTTNDFITLEIQNDQGRTVYETPGPLEAGFLDGTATSLSIPAHTLAPGRNYECLLTFGRVVDSDSATYPGVKAIAAFGRVTRFFLTTTGTPIVPTLEAIGLSNDQFRLRVHGEFRRTYSVQSTRDFLSWQDVISSNTDAVSTNGMGTVEVTDFGSPGSDYRFYRAIEGFSQQGQGGSN